MSLHAVILAGGYGSRMMPLTTRTPKHLLPIGDEPVIAHQLRRLAAAGVDSVTLATAHHAEAFLPALGHGERFGLHLRYTREPEPRGTGGALKHACAGLTLHPDDALVVINGDLVSDHDLAAHVRAHVHAGAPLATIHARPVDDASAFGLLHLDGDRITRFEEKPAGAPAGFVNAGTYVVSPSLLDLIPAGEVVSLERDVFPRAVALDEGVRVYREDARFADIGTPAALLAANLAWARDHVPSDRPNATSVLLSAQVAPTARVERCLVMPGAQIGADAVLTDSVLGPGCVIGDGAHLEGCVLGDGARVSPGLRLADAVLEVDERR